METVIAVVILLIILGLACLYIYKAKKRGDKCVGCPYAKTCGGGGGSCGCGSKKS